MDNNEFRDWAVKQLEKIKNNDSGLRATLAEDALSDDWDKLTSVVNDIATNRGALDVATTVAAGAGQLMTGAATLDDLKDYLLQRATGYPNDTWSGRRNDARRSFNEGLVGQIRATFEYIRYSTDA